MKKQSSNKKSWEVGAGVAAGIAGVLAAGYLVYEGTKPQHKKIKSWVASARRDTARELKKMKHVGAEEYDRLASKAIMHYGAIQKASAPEIAKAVQDARTEWKHINAEAKKMAKAKLVKLVRGAKPAKRKAARRTAKKRG